MRNMPQATGRTGWPAFGVAIVAFVAAVVFGQPSYAGDGVTPMWIPCDNYGQKWFSWSSIASPKEVTHARRIENFTGADMTAAWSVTWQRTITAGISSTVGGGASANIVVASLDANSSHTLQANAARTDGWNRTVTWTAKSGSGQYGVTIIYTGTTRVNGSYKYYYCPSSGQLQTLQSGNAQSWDIQTDGGVRCAGQTPVGLGVVAKNNYC